MTSPLLVLLCLPWISTQAKKATSNDGSSELLTGYLNTRKKIVLIHNFYRARVEPKATNMLEMTWHKGAQRAAQVWAESCHPLQYDDPFGRWVEDYGSCGQNVFVSSEPLDWMRVAKAWFMQHRNFTFGGQANDPRLVGHYTQMVWFRSHRVGCGFHFCRKGAAGKSSFYNYVCNYCPIGNDPGSFGLPYQPGPGCGGCPGHCKYKRLCTNSCPFSDLWVNCPELNSTWNRWLCGNEESERFKSCQATCRCGDAIL